MKLEHWVVVGFVALCAALTGVFAVGTWNKSYPDRSAASLHTIVHHELDLIPEQEQELERIEDQFAGRKAELEQRLRAANVALAEAIDRDKEYSEGVQAAIDEFHEAMGELQKMTIEHVFEMRSILTEEQTETFDAEVVRALTDY